MKNKDINIYDMLRSLLDSINSTLGNINDLDYSLEEVRKEIRSSLVVESLPSFLAHLWAKEFKLCSTSFSFLASKFDLKSRLQEGEVLRDLIMKLKHSCISVESEPENWRSSWAPHVE